MGGGSKMFTITLAIAANYDLKIDICIYLYALKYEDLKPKAMFLNMSFKDHLVDELYTAVLCNTTSAALHTSLFWKKKV